MKKSKLKIPAIVVSLILVLSVAFFVMLHGLDSVFVGGHYITGSYTNKTEAAVTKGFSKGEFSWSDTESGETGTSDSVTLRVGDYSYGFVFGKRD